MEGGFSFSVCCWRRDGGGGEALIASVLSKLSAPKLNSSSGWSGGNMMASWPSSGCGDGDGA